AETLKGPALVDPFDLRDLLVAGDWDMNRRPLGYERVKAMSGNPLILRERAKDAAFHVMRCCVMLVPISASFGGVMGAKWEQFQDAPTPAGSHIPDTFLALWYAPLGPVALSPTSQGTGLRCTATATVGCRSQ